MVLAHVAHPSSTLRSVLHSVQKASSIVTTAPPAVEPGAGAAAAAASAPDPRPVTYPPRSRARPAARRRSTTDSTRSSSSSAVTSAAESAATTSPGPSSASSHPPSRTASPPASAAPSGAQQKMHQTSSRLLRMTDEDRPFTRDFMDLFATLMVSLPLSPHRIRFQRVDHTFTSEEAINNLGSLKFSQSNRMPDPKDPSRIVTTTTTTTFSMAREMARSVCQRFLDARCIEPADGKAAMAFALKNAVWQLTPKGLHILARFCQRNGITQRHVTDAIDSPRNTMQLVNLERDAVTDKLSMERSTIEVVFRRFIGPDGPNTTPAAAAAAAAAAAPDPDAGHEPPHANGITGVKMAPERRVGDKWWRHTFTGRAASDWLMDCSTTIDRPETCELASQFARQGLMFAVVEDKAVGAAPGGRWADFQPTKAALYTLTEKGQRVAGWIDRDPAGADGEAGKRHSDGRHASRDSNTNRLTVILTDPALRLLFREFLRDTVCEENLAFYLDVVEFTTSYRAAVQKASTPRIDTVRETLAAAYGLYNAFLAPGSPCELNIDHNLRNNLASRMTRAVGDDQSMIDSLKEVAMLFEEAQNTVFKLMASDSVPKFLKEPRFVAILRDHDFDRTAVATKYVPTAPPERATSKLGR
ncbi:MAG: hypothetical protein M1826_007156 [Phylliscum demangeonii]|nr:MAG: hypothetical protein M1826_007156 [Phylliscum demangeonii]